MINLHVFEDFDFRPIFGGFLEGLGISKLVIFLLFFRIFYHANFEAFFWTAKNAIFGHIFLILGRLGGSCGPGKLKLRAWLKRKSPSMLNPYVEGNVYPFVVCFFGFLSLSV